MGNGKNIWETVIIFILLGIIICFLTPIIQTIFYSSQVSNAKANANEIVSAASVIYQDLSLERQVVLPFTLEFNEDGTYNLYERTTKIVANQTFEKDKGPSSGTVTLDENGEVSAKNITYKDIVCNRKKNKPMECTRKGQTGK